MGNYNADTNYNLPQMSAIARTMNFIPYGDLFSDQWSIDSANRVCSFHDGTNLKQCHVKFDPRVIPPS